MPRVLSVIATLDGSGAEKQFALLNAGLKARGWDVQAVALTRGGPYRATLEEADVPVTVLNKSLKFDPFCLNRLRRLVARWKPDLIHSWMFTANAYARMASGGRPVIVGERCVDRWKGGWQHAVDRRLLGRTTKIVGNSQAVADYVAACGAPANRLTVIPNGVEPLEPDPGYRAALLRSLDLPEDAQPVVSVGRLAPQKRPEDLVWAFQLLHQANPRAVHLVVGDGPLRVRCERLATYFDHMHRCRFLGQRADARQILANADALWFASEYEGQSNAVMEAMSAGVVPIVTDIPSNRELVTDAETGFLVTVNDSLGLCQWADRVLSDEALRKRIGAAARQRMRTEFSIEKMIDRYETLYRETLGAPETLSRTAVA